MGRKTFLDSRVVVKVGDITKEKVDALVNAANSSLMGGGGVDGAIHRAGGGDILKECKNVRSTRFPDGLPAGEAVLTSAGKLCAKYIVHTVGPVWYGGQNNEERILGNCYVNSLKLAVENNINTIAFPAISTGIYGYPKELAAKTSSITIKNFLKENDTLKQIMLIFFSKEDFEAFTKNARF